MISINVKLRPMKIAFLVDPLDREALLQAIQINTFLWGGMYNPIVPGFRRIPKAWTSEPFRSQNSRTILGGYLDAFDPDYVVQLGKCTSRTVEIGDRERIHSTELIIRSGNNSIPGYGVGVFEIAEYLIRKELKYLRAHPLLFLFPNISKQHKLFLTSVFGALPEHLNKLFWDSYSTSLQAQRKPCSILNYQEFLSPNNLFMRRLGSYGIKATRRHTGWRDQCILYLDATSSLDIIDYWNLRAVGWNVLPIPKQASKQEDLKALAKHFIEENSTTILQKSRSIQDNEFDNFVRSLHTPRDEKTDHPKILVRNWQPRIWDEWARGKDGVECCELEADKITHDLPSDQDEIRVRTLDPKFISRFGHGGGRFANNLDFRFYKYETLLAEILPPGGRELGNAIGDLGFREWRFSQKGLVHLAHHPNWSIYLQVPKAEDLFISWLKSKNWDAVLSTPGRIAKQMIKQLGGKFGMNILSSEELIQLLGRMSDGRTMNKDAFWAEMSRIANSWKSKVEPEPLLKKVTDIQMFRLGIEVQCPICWQRSWYSLTDADYQLQCSKCLEVFLIRSRTPQDIEWSYRTFGPFSLPRQAYGVYSVILTFRFFSNLLNSATTPIMSFTAVKNDKRIEADLGLFYQSNTFGPRLIELIFAECKTFNSFEKKDSRRMALLANEFPGATLVFATLKKSLTENEKSIIKPIVNSGRRYWKSERPYNPVLILTGTELFSTSPLEDTWKNVYGDTLPFKVDYSLTDDLLRICEATQQIYLGMEPWHQWLEERREQRRIIRNRMQNRKESLANRSNSA